MEDDLAAMAGFTEDEQKTAAYIERLTAMLQEQVKAANGWPASFVFPEPEDHVEREALGLFVELVEQETGARPKFTTKPGTA